MYLRPFLFFLFSGYVGCLVLLYLLVVPYVSEGVYLFGSFLFYFLSFLSLFVIFFTLQVDLCMLVQVKQIGWVLQSFYYKIRGTGGLYSGWGWGISKLWVR